MAEFPSLSCVEDGQIDALLGLVQLVGDVLEDMGKAGEDVPTPFGRRRFSGKYPLRMSEKQHRRVAMEAAEQGVPSTSCSFPAYSECLGGIPARKLLETIDIVRYTVIR